MIKLLVSTGTISDCFLSSSTASSSARLSNSMSANQPPSFISMLFPLNFMILSLSGSWNLERDVSRNLTCEDDQISENVKTKEDHEWTTKCDNVKV